VASLNELIAKRRAETLTPDEHAALIALSDQIEDLNARRVECLAELARLRQLSLSELMQQLGLKLPLMPEGQITQEQSEPSQSVPRGFVNTAGVKCGFLLILSLWSILRRAVVEELQSFKLSFVLSRLQQSEIRQR